MQKTLAADMEAAAATLDFERAAVLRDRLSALSAIQSHQGINPAGVEEADLFALAQEGGQSCVEVFFFRTGQNWGNRAFFPRADRTFEAGEVLASFLTQFYDDKPVPRLILVSHPVAESALLEEALSTKAGHKVAVVCPARGDKKDLIAHAAQNAREALGRGSPNTPRSRSCSPRSPPRSACRSRRSASRCSTIRTSWAPTRSARWWWRVPKASARRTTAPSTSSRRTSSRATTTA